MNENGKSGFKRFLNWAVFIIIIGLVIWGLVAAQNKAAREQAGVLLPTQISETDHIHGGTGTSTLVTLVEYGDFQCPACGAYYPLVEQVVASEPTTTLRFVFRHFPLSQHQNAVPAAQASEAAANQGKFWEMYNKLYSTQDSWATSTDPKTIFLGYAKELGLDQQKFAADYESKAVQDVINNDYTGGVKAGINSTPTFFINGVKITNPQGYDEFKADIDNAVPKISL